MKEFFKPNKVIIVTLIIFIVSLVTWGLYLASRPLGRACFDEFSCQQPQSSIIETIITKILWIIFIPLGFVLNAIGDYLGIRGGFFALVAILFFALVYIYLISCIINFIIYKIRTRKEVISVEKRKSDTIISVLIIVAIIIAGIIDVVFSQKL